MFSHPIWEQTAFVWPQVDGQKQQSLAICLLSSIKRVIPFCCYSFRTWTNCIFCTVCCLTYCQSNRCIKLSIENLPEHIQQIFLCLLKSPYFRTILGHCHYHSFQYSSLGVQTHFVFLPLFFSNKKNNLCLRYSTL